MINAWLERMPKIYQQSNPYADYYGRFYVSKGSPNSSLYLHKDGIWRTTTFNPQLGEYSGYFITRKEAEEAIENEKRLVKKGR